MKECKECHKIKPEIDFCKDRTAKDGLRYRCKACDAIFRNWVKNNHIDMNIKEHQQQTIDIVENIQQNKEVVEGKKKCSCCKQWKDLDCFYNNKNNKDGKAQICKYCQEARKAGKLPAYVPQWKIRNEKGQKQCTKCKQWKYETEFSKGNSPDGLNTICKLCDKTRAARCRKPREQYAYEMYNEQGQKQCSKCKQWKSTENFCICTANKDGLNHYCRQCQHEYDMKRRETPYVPNYLQHKDGKKFCLTCKTWVSESEFYKSKQSKDGLSSRCKFCQQKYDKEHKEQISERQRKYRLEKIKNPAFRLSERMSAGMRRALKQNKAGQHWEDLVPYNIEQLRQHLESQFTPEMSWDNMGEYWEVDHIIPQNMFNFTTYKDKDFQICWSLMNLRPLNWLENRQRPKNGSDISEELKQKILNQKLN